VTTSGQTSAEQEELLRRAAAAGIHRIAVPMPFLVGRVNCYLIEERPLTLVDTGPNSGKSLDELEVAMAALGHAIEDLELIVITHSTLITSGCSRSWRGAREPKLPRWTVSPPTSRALGRAWRPTTSSRWRSCAAMASR
jgi:hypothetical protein